MRVWECEERIAAMGGRRWAVLCSRATVGLAGALKALGLPRGSGVVTPVMACANVAQAVRGAGLRPVFVDVEVQRGGIGMNLESGERVVDEGCRVLLAVPLFGGEVYTEGLKGFAERHGLVVVEDNAQCGVRGADEGRKTKDEGRVHHRGAEDAEGRRGSLGVYSVVSFGRGKVGDAGGGGAVLGDDWELLERVRKYCLLRTAYSVEGRGVDVGRIWEVLEGMDGEIGGRLRQAREHREGLGSWMATELGVERVEHVGEVLPVWKYSVLVRDREERDRVTRGLLERGVEATNLYPPLSVWFRGVEGERYEEARGTWERIVNMPL